MGTKVHNNYEDLITFTRASGGHALRPVSYGTEEVVNGDFSTDSNWVKQTGWSISGGTANWDGVSSVYLQQADVFTPNTLYTITFTISNNTSGTISIRDGAATVLVANTTYANGTYSFNVVSTSNSSLRIYGVAGSGSLSIDNISVKEVTFDESDGTLTLFEHPENVPRVEYDADGNRLGLLVEESRTNLVTHSQDFDNSSWDTFASSISANTATAPDGTVTADTLIEDTSSNYRYVSDALGAISANWTFSAFVKKKDDDIQIQLRPIGVGSGKAFATFDPADGSLLYSGGTNLVSTSTTNVGNGWHRISMTVDLALTSASHGVMLVLVAGQSTEFPSYTGTGKGVYIWGAQVEASASFPTSYIKSNSGSTTTRSADVATMNTADFGYNALEGCVVCDVSMTFDTSVTNYPRFWELGHDDNGNERIMHYVSTSNDGVFYELRTNNVTQASGTIKASVGGSYTGKLALTWKKDSVAATEDGDTPVTDSAANIEPNEIRDQLSFGASTTSGSYMVGHIKSFKYYPRRLTDAQIQALTEPRSTPTLSLTFDGQESSYKENYIHG